MNKTIIRHARMRGSLWREYPLLCLAISVGKAVHEGNDLAAAIDMLASTGKPCVMRVSDTLQRHNLMADGMNAQEAWEHSRAMGNRWLAQNSLLFEKLPTPPVIVRWNDVLSDPDFEKVHTSFTRLAEKDQLLRKSLHHDIERFCARRAPLTDGNYSVIAAHSRAFLLEELAGQTILGRHFSYARLYPGNPPETLRIVRDGLIPEAPKGLENTAFVRLSLETRHTVAA